MGTSVVWRCPFQLSLPDLPQGWLTDSLQLSHLWIQITLPTVCSQPMTEPGGRSGPRPLLLDTRLLSWETCSGSSGVPHPPGLAETFSELHCGLRLLSTQFPYPPTLSSHICIKVWKLLAYSCSLPFFLHKSVSPPKSLIHLIPP